MVRPRTLPWIALVSLAVLVGVLHAGQPRADAADSSLTRQASIAMVAADSAPGPMTAVIPYFFLGSTPNDAGGPFLVPVYREVPQTVAVARAAVEALIAGPSVGEGTSVPAISSAVPAGTRLLNISVTNGTASVDLSAEFASGAGAFSVRGRLVQLVYTLTRFPTVDSVRLLIEGQPVTTFSSEGVEIDAPLTRADFSDFLPAILVDDPVYGGPAGNPLRVTGNADVFEGRFRLTLTDQHGLIIAETPVLASCGTGCRGAFDVTVPYTVTSEQRGSLIVAELSAEDGHPTHIREYPVLLSPR